MSTQADVPVVYKYFDLIDEFIKVRILPDHIPPAFLKTRDIQNKREYRRRVIDACIVDLEEGILPQIAETMPEELSIAEDLLYQICIDVNPRLEIHQVAIPADSAEESLASLLQPELEEPGRGKQFHRKAATLEKELRKVIIGQDDAIAALARSVRKAATGLAEPNRPMGCMLFVGKTGTGKTAMAKCVSRHLFDRPGSLVRIDCSEYALPHEYAKLIGAPPGYVGHGEGGMLTEAVRKNPDAVILFDEIEKAHSKLHHLLLQVLDEGYLTDSKGRSVNFERALVLLTSNVGVDELKAAESRMGFDSGNREISRSDIREWTLGALKGHFSPEFLNRLDDIIVFNDLSKKDAEAIAELTLAEVAGRSRRTGIRVMFSGTVSRFIAEQGFSPEYGAREIRRVVKQEIEDQLASLILDGKVRRGQKIRVTLRGGKPNFQIQKRR